MQYAKPVVEQVHLAADVVKTANDAAIQGHKVQIYTNGAEGLKYSGPQGVIHMPSVTPPAFVDACGYGDCVSVCCIDSLCEGGTIRDGLARGTRLAALNCCYPGPWRMMDSTTRRYRKRRLLSSRVAGTRVKFV